MLELESRLIASNLVERLRACGQQPFQIQIRPNGSGITARVGFANSLVVEAHVPPGWFDYDRVVEAMCEQITTAVIDSDS